LVHREFCVEVELEAQAKVLSLKPLRPSEVGWRRDLWMSVP
jgi:hypothetical protein